jgi:SAM-dependent methyltransferase
MNEVREQYESWVYPLPVQDLDEDAKAGGMDGSDPSQLRRKFWPRPVEPQKLKILIAGCGTNQAARHAYRNPGCEVVGVDISQSSLAHEAYLKDKHTLANLRLHCLSILDIEKLGEQFDLIVSTGVLHHLPDPDAGLRKLKTVLLPHGVMSIMVYGWYRRFGVYMMQEAFRLLGIEQTKEGVGLVRETLDALPEWHHVKSYVKGAPDLNFDGGCVDTFLHRADRPYTVTQVLRLASDNGLSFQDWIDRHGYSISALVPDTLAIHPLAARLKPEEQWQLAELLSQSLGTHKFLLCHPERDPSDYSLDFTHENAQGAAWPSYIPHLRQPIKVLRLADPHKGTSATLQRFVYEFTVDEREGRMLELVDGKRSIADIIKMCSPNDNRLEENRGIGLGLFSRMHDWDHLLVQIP